MIDLAFWFTVVYAGALASGALVAVLSIVRRPVIENDSQTN